MSLTSKFLTALSGDPLKVAEKHLREGDKLRAAEAFARGGDLRRAAKLAAEAGAGPRAAEYALRAVLGGVPEGFEEASPAQAGDLLFSSGHAAEAMPLFELGGAWTRAAECAARLGQAPRAGRYYEKARQFRLAANVYRRASLWQDALRALDQESQRLSGEGRARREAGVEAAIEEVVRERAEVLRHLGRDEEAARVVQTAAPTLKTGRILEGAGHIEEAIRAYIAVGEHDNAVALLGQATQIQPAERARILLECKRPLEAAGLFAQLRDFDAAGAAADAGGDLAKAARFWEQGERFARAADAYRRLGRWADAARCAAAAGDPAAAADAFERSGDLRRAAHAYSRAGRVVEAASCYLRVGEKEQATRLLQQVVPTSGEGPRATLLLVPLLLERNQADEALARLEMAGAESGALGLNAGPEAARLYWQGRALEDLGRHAEAANCYRKAELARPGTEDAAARLDALRLGGLVGRTGAVAVPDGTAQAAAAVAEAAAALFAATQAAPARQGVGPAPAGDWSPGSVVLDRYEIRRELGRGGMGRVYLALDRELQEEIAIKTVLSRADDPDAQAEEERLRREVQILRRLTHPNIVRVHDLGRFDGGLFVTMELVDGQRLDQLIERLPRPPFERVRAILRQVCAGLAVAHGAGVIHRDLKPGNIILSSQRLKILDFGIARAVDRNTRLTMTGFAVGTPAYMSPEQLRGLPLDGRSDLYALGVLAFTLIAGREPFQGSTPTAVALEHLQTPPPDLRPIRPDTPGVWNDFVQRLLAKTPEARFPTALATAEALAVLPPNGA